MSKFDYDLHRLDTEIFNQLASAAMTTEEYKQYQIQVAKKKRIIDILTPFVDRIITESQFEVIMNYITDLEYKLADVTSTNRELIDEIRELETWSKYVQIQAGMDIVEMEEEDERK